MMLRYLRDCISAPDICTIRIATGYWDIPGLSLVKDELCAFLTHEHSQLKLLIGKDPYVYAKMVKEPKYANQSYPEGFIRTGIEELAGNLTEEYKDALQLLQTYCTGSTPKIQIHIFKNAEDESQFLHSKCYIFSPEEGGKGDSYAIVGSSNFTGKGLTGNAELNVLENNQYMINAHNLPNCKGHIEWFEEKWVQSEEWTKEFLEEVLQKSSPVKRMKEEEEKEAPLTPYELYIKLLQYNFSDLLDVNLSNIIESYLPVRYVPLEYQLDAVKQCFSIMKTHGGFMLSDVVGLGKTIVGTLVIKYFLNYPDDERERRVLVITPPAIRSAWVKTIRDFDEGRDNQIEPLVDFVTTGSISNLLDDEDEEDSGEFNDSLDYHNYGLVLIDESHKFRNSGTMMYEALDDLIAQIGANTGYYPYIGLLSATPQNNTPNDLKNQIYLFERNHQYCTFDKVDGRNLESFFADIMKEYNTLRARAAELTAMDMRLPEEEEELRKTNEGIKQLSIKIRDTILCDILVRRTRTDIKKYYADDMQKQHLVFPSISGPHSLKYKMDDELARLFADTMSLIAPSEDFKFNNSNFLCYYRYRAIQFLCNAKDRNKYKGGGSRDADTLAVQLAKIMQILLVKRLESSFTAFTTSLLNLRTYTENMIKMWENNTIFICPQIDVNAELDEDSKTLKRKRKVMFGECVEDIRKKIQEKTDKGLNEKGQNAEYTRDDFDSEYIKYVKEDYKLISKLYDRWSKNSEDPKLDEFKESLRPVLFNPQTNRPQKLVIFTEAVDTVQVLKRACEKKGFKVLAITAANRNENEQTISENFDANYKDTWKDDYQIIITTEVLAEGINLHRANVILNYDTPWNSTRLMQRIGRVNRIGSSEPYVYVYNFMPSAEGDRMIQLVEKAHIKLQSFHSLFGEDSKVFTEEETVTHYDLNKFIDGEESAYEKYIHQLKEFRAKHPERYQYISQKQDDLQMAVSRQDGSSYFLVRTPKMKGLFVEVNAQGKGRILSGLDMYSHFLTQEDEPRTSLPEDWKAKQQTAIRTVGQHLSKLKNYRINDAAATKAKGVVMRLSESKQLSEHSQALIDSAFQLVSKGNRDIIRIINQVGKQLFEGQLDLFGMSQHDIDEIISHQLDKIVEEQSITTGKPEVYIGLSK
jgi:superfamily II DNA/RNA helicase